MTDYHTPGTPSYEENAEGFGLTRDTMIWFWANYLNDGSEGAHPHASPLRAPDLSGLPPTLVITAEYDPLGCHSQSRRRLGRRPSEWPGALFCSAVRSRPSAPSPLSGWRRVFRRALQCGQPAIATARMSDPFCGANCSTRRGIAISGCVSMIALRQGCLSYRNRRSLSHRLAQTPTCGVRVNWSR
jgi:hypothetical protein